MHTTNAMNIINLVVQTIEGSIQISEVRIVEGLLYTVYTATLNRCEMQVTTEGNTFPCIGTHETAVAKILWIKKAVAKILWIK